jgi:hypothetical protein
MEKQSNPKVNFNLSCHQAQYFSTLPDKLLKLDYEIN